MISTINANVGNFKSTCKENRKFFYFPKKKRFFYC